MADPMPVWLVPTAVGPRTGGARSLRTSSTADFVIHEHRNPPKVFRLQIGTLAAEYTFKMI